MQTMVEVLRRLVRPQTEGIGQPVTNIYGAVALESPPLAVSVPQRWLWSRMPARTLLSLIEFFGAFNVDEGGQTSVVEGREGFTVVTSIGQQLHFLRGTVRIPATMAVPLVVSTGGAQGEWAVYVDGVLQRRGNGEGQLTLSFDRGNHTIEVMAYADVLGVAVPKELEIFANQENLRRPTWESIRPGYLDAFMAVSANKLRWFNDARVGGWKVMRRETEFLGPAIDLSSASTRGEFGLVLSGDQTPVLEFGEELTAGVDTMGSVVGATWDSEADQTAVRVRLSNSVPGVNPDWVSRPVGSGRFMEIARVKRATSAGIIEWPDQMIKIGTIYEYKLQSFGLVDESQTSPWSEIEYIRAGDIEPPGDIVMATGYPVINAGRATARFTTPEDEDYAGVRVYFRRAPIIGSVTGATLSSITDVSASWLANQFTNYTVQVIGPTDDEDLFALVASNDATTLFTSGDMPSVPSGGLAFHLWFDDAVITDFGTPAQEDQVAFDLVLSGGLIASGDYFFRSFDHAGNEQSVGVTWSGDMAFGLAPLFQAFSGETIIFSGADPKAPSPDIDDGAVWLYFELDAASDELFVYFEQSLTSPVEVPEQSNQNLAWHLTRQEGTIPQTGRWAGVLPCATKPLHWQRVYAFTKSKLGARSPTYTAEVQAVDVGVRDFPILTNWISSRSLTSVDMQWEVPSPCTSTHLIETVLFRNGYPLKRFPHGNATYPLIQTFSDTAIASDVDYFYNIFLLAGGKSGFMNGMFVNIPTTSLVLEGTYLGAGIFQLQWTGAVAPITHVEVWNSTNGFDFNADGTSFDVPTGLTQRTRDQIPQYYKLLRYNGASELGWSNTILIAP